MVKSQKKLVTKNMELKKSSSNPLTEQQHGITTSTTTNNNNNGTTKTKEKRRNNEKRKEKSRDAARCRRSRETEIFTELAHALPVKKEEIEQLDKASVMRLAISYLKVRGMVDLFPKMQNLSIEDDNETENKEMKPLDLLDSNETQKIITQALDGFVLVLSGDGDVTFVSENVTEFLGISQLDLMGQPIWEYSHQCDHDELREALNGRRASPLEVQSGKIGSDVHPLVHRDFFLRLKCTLTSRGRSVNIKSASYKVIHVSGHIATNDNQRQLVSLCRPLPHPSNIEVPMGSSTFLTKHSLDMKFSYVDEKMYSLLGYQPQDLIGTPFYECHHGEDSESLLATFKSLISKGQTETCRYRFLARCGGFCWIVTQATLVYDKQKPQSVVCVNYVISGVENKDEIYSCAQLDAQNDSVIVKEEKSVPTPIEKPLTPQPILVQEKKILGRIAVVSPFSNLSKPRSVTAAIFAAASAAPLPSPSSQPIELPSVLITPPTISLSSPHQQLQHLLSQQTQQRGISVTAKVFTPRPQPVTSKLFVPRTEDMNKGFLMFSEEEPGLTMLKDEPDDLTHLAPTAGDACIPLEETTPFFTDMFDDFILPDTYCTLLSDDINSLDSQSSTNKAHNNTDPFINYRDESSDTTSGGSPNILSPGLAKSPAGSSLPSLCSPDGSLPEEELTFMTMNMDDELDLTMRAPYIPMTEADDLPLLLSDDLMWGAFPEGLSLHKEINNNSNNSNINKKEKIDSSLAALLCGEQQLNQQQQNQQLPPLLNTQLIQTQHLHIQQQQQIQEQESRKTNLIDQGGGSCNNNNINNNNTSNNSNNNNTDNNSNLGNSSNNDVLGQVFNKSCTNLDPTWTMTDLLQIKSNHINNINNSNHNNSSLSIQTHLQHHHQQQQQQSHQSISPSLVTISKQQQQQHHHHQQQQQQQQKTERHHITQNHKRPSNIPTLETTCTTKRIKSCEPQSSPQLLQQLMAPSPTPILKSRIKSEKLDGRWNCNTMGGITPQQQKQLAANLQQQSSNSVLMNLLVSGCDDDITMDSSDFYMKDICDDISSSSSSSTKRKINQTTVVNPNILLSDSAINRKALNPTVGAHNPLIGGTNLLTTVSGGDGGVGDMQEPDVSHKLKAIAIDRNKGLKLNENVAGKILPVVSFMDTETIAIPTLYELMSNEFDLMPDTDLI